MADLDPDAYLDAVLVGGQRVVFVQLAEADPAWPQEFLAHRTHLLAALGGQASQLDHVGSTAVPGLAAKPVVDVQLVVSDVEREQDYLPALEGVGYLLRVREPGHRMVAAAPALGATNIHIHEDGDPQLADRLRLRDRLRADPASRERYEQVKRSLAGRVWPEVNHYAEAKSEVIAELLAEAGCPQIDADRPAASSAGSACGHDRPEGAP